jgi:multidrug resistance protein MdtO
MLLRLGGVIVGGAVALATIIVVTPNFDTVVSYMIVTFSVLIFFAWEAQSSSRIAYAGSQAGTTFVLVFAGLRPSEQIYEPLWRLWSVILGVIVTSTVFLLMWREYAEDTAAAEKAARHKP